MRPREKTREIARALGLSGLKIAAVTGDDVLDAVKAGDYRIEETGGRVNDLGNRIVSANAYLGAGADRRGARGRRGRGHHRPDRRPGAVPGSAGARVRLGDGRLGRARARDGRRATCSNAPDRSRAATSPIRATRMSQDLARLGFPIGEVGEDGSVVITKVPGSGGQVTLATCKEQLLYEVHDPARYYQPDVVADFSEITMSEAGPDRVRVEGARGAPKTGSLKVSVGYIDSYVGEGQISYAGPGALARGRLALEIVRERLALTGVSTTETRFDLIGVDALHGEKLSART